MARARERLPGVRPSHVLRKEQTPLGRRRSTKSAIGNDPKSKPVWSGHGLATCSNQCAPFWPATKRNFFAARQFKQMNLVVVCGHANPPPRKATRTIKNQESHEHNTQGRIHAHRN